MTPALNPNGVKGKPLDSNSLRRGESAAYALARLKRDAPDLAEKVIHGDVSAEARQKWNERRAVIRDAMTPALNKHGGDRSSSSESELADKSDTATYALARLKRDAPDLAEKVIHGDVSAEARQKWNERRARILDALGLPDDAAAYRVTLHEPGTNQHSEVGHVGSTGAKYSTTGTAYTVARLA
jgi:hypothetical protein